MGRAPSSTGNGSPSDLAWRATGIGSLPHRDPVEAAEFVLARLPELPAVPSLPRRSRREAMLAQGAVGIPGVRLGLDGAIHVEGGLDPEAPVVTDLGDDAFTGFRTFLDVAAGRADAADGRADAADGRADAADGRADAADGCADAAHGRVRSVKWQLTGPVTLGLALLQAGVPTELAFRVAARAVHDRARALRAAVAEALPDALQVVFLDEPGLVGLQGACFPIAPDDGVDLLSGALAVLEPHCVAGVHVCGPADWGVVLSAGPTILSAPVGAGLPAAAGAIAALLGRGGIVAWGAVPTDGPVGLSAARYWRAISAEWCELVQHGCDALEVRARSIVTPVCGLAGHGTTQAERVLRLVDVVARRTHEQATAARISLGA